MKTFPFYKSSLVVALLVGIFFSACGVDNSKEATETAEDVEETAVTEVRQIEKEVLAIHDEVMPKMAELNNTRKKLIGKLQSQDSTGHSVVMRDVIYRLEEADSLMWDWMHNYSRPDYEANLDSARMYLSSELEKVTVMRDKFNASLSDGTTLLDELNADNE